MTIVKARFERCNVSLLLDIHHTPPHHATHAFLRPRSFVCHRSAPRSLTPNSARSSTDIFFLVLELALDRAPVPAAAVALASPVTDDELSFADGSMATPTMILFWLCEVIEASLDKRYELRMVCRGSEIRSAESKW
jgi:hypothetical protein